MSRDFQLRVLRPGFLASAVLVFSATLTRAQQGLPQPPLATGSRASVVADSSDPGQRGVVRYEPFAIVSRWGTPVVRAELGRFRVRENRTSPSTKEIELAFVRIPTVAENPGPPILWLAGGPGESGIADLETPILRLFLELRNLGDVFLLDQRGSGRSTPRLDCPGAFHFPLNVALDRTRALDGLEVNARACAELWRTNGADLSAYNTRESAEDIEDLRLAVRANRFRLLAGSYGTHLALAAIRVHEQSFDRAVLIGVVGPDHLRPSPKDLDDVLLEVSRGAGRDGRTPDLLAAIQEIRDRLKSHPEAVAVSTRDGSSIPVVVGSFDFELFTRNLLFSRRSIAHLPAAIGRMASGDFSELAFVTARWRSSPSLPALGFAMRCASGASPKRIQLIEASRHVVLLGDAVDFAEKRVCRAWGVDPLPEDFRSDVHTSVPTLIISGTLDGEAPESNASEILRGLPNGEHLSVIGAAHESLGFEDKVSRAAIVRFFEGQRLQADFLKMAALSFEPVAPIHSASAEQSTRTKSVSFNPPFLAGP